MRIKSQTAAGVTETMTFTFQGGQNTHVCYIITPCRTFGVSAFLVLSPKPMRPI